MSSRNSSLPWCVLLWITVTVSLSQCYKMAAFMYAPIGTQVFVSNTTTGDINYSLCNSNGTPIYPTDPPKILPTLSRPKNGTSIGAVGWNYQATWADVMYQDEQNSLVAVRYSCNMATGEYTINTSGFPTDPRYGNNAPTPHETTNFAGVILSSTDGERWLYHDTTRKLQSIRYMTNGGVGKWTYEGPVSPDMAPGLGIGLAMTPAIQNTTAVFPKDDGNIEVSTYGSDASWYISTFPSPLVNASTTTWTSNYNATLPVDTSETEDVTLTGWTGTTSSLGFVIDTSLARWVFYIDSNSTLQMATSAVKNGNFTSWAPTDASFSSNGSWPLADEANADFATASNSGSYDIRIYYMSKGRINQVSKSSQFGWDEAVPLDPVNTTVPVSTPAPPSNSTVAPAPSNNSGLSIGASVGIGVGVGIAGLALIGLGVCFFLRQRRSRRAHDENNQAVAAAAAAEQMTNSHPQHFDSAHNSQQYDQHAYGHQQQYDQQYDQNGAPYYYQGGDKNNPERTHNGTVPIGELGTMYEQSHELPAVIAEPKERGVHYIPSDGHVSPTPTYTGPQVGLDPEMAHAAEVSHGQHHHDGSGGGQYLDESGSYGTHTQPTSPTLTAGQVSPTPRYSSLSYHSRGPSNSSGINTAGGLSPSQDYGGDELHIYADHGSPTRDAAAHGQQH